MSLSSNVLCRSQQNLPRSLLWLVAALCVAVLAHMAPAQDQRETEITVPQGFRISLVHEGVGPARHLTVRDNGDIYIALRQPQNGGIVALRDADRDGRAEIIQRFGELGGTGIRIRDSYLYFAHTGGVIRYRLQPGELVPQTPPETVVEGFPEQSSHADKSIAFDNQGRLYVNVGAPSNACQRQHRTPHSPGLRPCPSLDRHAGIWRFPAGRIGLTQQQGERFATGIRQALAMAWHDTFDNLYIVAHGRDQLHSLWPEHYTEEENARLPAEEFLLVREGDDYGWPYTYYDPFRNARMVAPEYGGDGETPVQDDLYADPIMAFPAHWAPNDMLFYTGSQFPQRYRGGALVAFHGSWNRYPLPQQGFKVAFVPMVGGRPSGKYEIFADGFAGQEIVPKVSDARWRPMGLAIGPQGALYIVDSKVGRLWRVEYVGE